MDKVSLGYDRIYHEIIYHEILLKMCFLGFLYIYAFSFCIFFPRISDPQGELWIQSCSQREKDPEQTALRHGQGTPPSPQHHHAAEERAQHQAAGAILLQTD